MLSRMKNMFLVPDLRNKILFTLFILAMFRLGSHVPVPGIDFQQVQRLADAAASGGVLGFLNLFSGGALTRFAVFGLGIMPYITSSIIMQLLQVVIPKLEEWREQGAVGQKKITQATRYLTVALALMQSTGLAFVFSSGQGGEAFGIPNDIIVLERSLPRVLLVVLSMTAGTAVVMWLGELITQRGIGQGMSLLIFASVVSALPAAFAGVRAQAGWVVFGLLTALSIFVLVAVVFVEQGQRRIPVQFAKRNVGKRVYGGQSTYIPLKVNQSGVIPIIFASSVLSFPVLFSNVVPWDGFRSFVDSQLQADKPTYILLYGLMIVGFAYFYTAISFDPVKQATYLKNQGGYIPGHRPGPQTERHLARILNRITLPGALFLAVIALMPSVLLVVANVQNFPFAGTTLLIAVGVALETMKQIDSQLTMRSYEGFLAK